ncbi:SMP-30/gluconolactonase/LRE family protein [Actinophytocola sp.]|uniref:SMP-30/gluconolactonase/LRE family protein n=1 Tax=Actinophytocola sp. TaxID=1872138 RepID=UPI002EDA8DCB
MTATPEPVGPTRARLGEGPCWDDDRQVLWWLDINGNAVHRTRPDGTTATVPTPDRPTALAPLADGRLLVALAGGLAVLDTGGDAGTGEVTARLDLPLEPGVRLNDGACDPLGRFWVGSMAEDEEPGRGHLYRVRDGRVDTVLDDVWLSNGIDWSPDGSLMYYIDSLTRRVDVFDFGHDAAGGDVSNRRTLVEVPAAAGIPDGLTVDTDGAVWVAFFGGGAVRRYTPAGELDREIPLPAANVTACAFGGSARDRLFITTAAGPGTHAGALFTVHTGHQGNPTRYLDLSHLPGSLSS